MLSVAIGTDGAPPLVQPRNPPPSILNIPQLPVPAGRYRYVLFKLGPVQLTRRGLSLAVMSACLTFTVRNQLLAVHTHMSRLFSLL